jgi:hypothetical protein
MNRIASLFFALGVVLTAASPQKPSLGALEIAPVEIPEGDPTSGRFQIRRAEAFDRANGKDPTVFLSVHRRRSTIWGGCPRLTIALSAFKKGSRSERYAWTGFWQHRSQGGRTLCGHCNRQRGLSVAE